MKHLRLCMFLVICTISPVSAQYAPVPGGEDLYDLYSPRLLAEGAPVAFGTGPQTDVVNPATSALVQRTTLDASYIALTGFGERASNDGWQGHVVNLGLVSPTRAAVFSGSFHIVASALAGMPLGSSGWIHGSAAKELYPGWLVGTGVRLGAGLADSFDFGIALDLGIVRTVGNVGSFEDFVWGAAFQNIGKWYDPFDTYGRLPSAFTPSGGVSFAAFRNDWLTLQAAGTLSAPGFRNIRAGVTGKATLFDAVAIHAGWKLDLRQLVDAGIDQRSLIPSFGISGSFRTGLGSDGVASERGWSESEIHTQTGAAPLYNGIWAIGAGFNAPLGIIDTTGPDVTIDYPDTLVISPNNDGTQDALTIPVGITDDRFVMEWWFEVENDSRVVRTLRNKDERPENEGFQSIVDRIVSVQAGIQIPGAIRWDGSGDNGETVPDGTYRFRLSAADDNGNIGSSPWYTVEVDATAPVVVLDPPDESDRIFSPNDDGNKDVIAIGQSGSVEELWRAEIVNALGTPVYSRSWPNSNPDRFEWAGQTDSGDRVPDGVYRYRISTVDEGGNSASAEVANIIVNTESTPVGLQVSSAYFSPNSDGTLDSVALTPSVPNMTGIESWRIDVIDAFERGVWSYEDRGGAPQPVEWRGRTGDGLPAPEGSYRARLAVVYRNGNRPSGESPEFVIDITPPTVAVQADRTLFSPNGDGKLDSVTLFQETSREERWIATVATPSGAVVRRFVWPNLAEQQVTWNGRQDDGRLAEDGTYFYSLQSTDRAGNQTTSEPIGIELDTSESEVGIRAEFDAFSPNADGVRDRQQFSLRVDRAQDVRLYSIQITDASGSVIRRFEGRSAVQTAISWDGTDPDLRRVPDGIYRAGFNVEFLNGIELSAGTAEFVVDTTPPSITVTTPFRLFSPDGDGVKDSVRIVQTSSAEEQWTGSIIGDGRVVRELVWAGRVGSVNWDGRDPAGNIVPDGQYLYRVEATDRAGNRTVSELDGLTVDTREPRLFITTSTSAFSPNGDGVRDDFAFDLYANLLDGSTGWTVTVRTEDGLVVREFSGSTLQDAWRITWDGRDGRGTVREGAFTAEFAVDYVKGNRPRASTGRFRVDVSPPDVAIRLEPLPFSPDNDGVDDELRIEPRVQDESDILAWSLEILDRNNRFFNEFVGRGSPASRIVWDGRASDGELVISAEDYPYRFTVRDELGNTTVEQGVIPVDILVIRDGDRLKVQIPSITFAPNSPELIIDSADERGAKNRAILLRLAEIFDKYASYSIRIEGHAVNVSGTEEEERNELQPLSLQRAQSVKDAMVDLGISDRRVSVMGRGGTEPIVPHDDTEERWKNRRVEFVLIR